MHQALLIEDIQLYILNQIEHKSDLSALARTCQAFTQIALDVLWRDLDSFIRLIQCMPSVIKIPRPSSGSKAVHYTLRRPLSSLDWVIFHKYSYRVRSIEFSGEDGFSDIWIDGSLILAFCIPPQPIPLLPNLTSLEWPVQSGGHLLALRQLVPAPLISLTLIFSDPAYLPWYPENTLQIPLPQICPSLRNFTVEGSAKNIPPKVQEELKRSISQLKHLDTIWWHEPGIETIMSFAQLPTLTNAIFEIPSKFPLPTNSLPSHTSTLKPAFSKVRELEINYSTLTSVVVFLNHFTFDLDKLRVASKCPTPSTRTSIGKFCAALASSSSSSTREIAILDKYHSSTTYQGLHPLSISELRRLFRLERLDILCFDLCCPILLDDATLLEMSHSWPNISQLLLNQGGYYDPTSSVTPLALVRLLNRCPKLKLLALPVDFSIIDSETFDPSTVDGLCDPCRMDNRANLSELWLGSYHIKYPHAIAKFLASLVPGRADITMEVEGDVDYVYKKKWKLTLTYREQLLNEEGGGREGMIF